MCIKWYSRLYRVKYHTVVNTDILWHPNNNEDLVAWDWDGTMNGTSVWPTYGRNECLGNTNPPLKYIFGHCVCRCWSCFGNRALPVMSSCNLEDGWDFISCQFLCVDGFWQYPEGLRGGPTVYLSRNQSLTDRQDFRLKFVKLFSFESLGLCGYAVHHCCVDLFIFLFIGLSGRFDMCMRVCVSEQILYMLAWVPCVGPLTNVFFFRVRSKAQ